MSKAFASRSIKAGNQSSTQMKKTELSRAFCLGKPSQAKQKVDLSPNVFNSETLNSYLAFLHNVGLPYREPDWSWCPTHCLGGCILAHRQASAQVLGICGV